MVQNNTSSSTSPHLAPHFSPYQSHSSSIRTCTTTTPNPNKIANGLLNTLTPNPPNSPSTLPRLICRIVFGFSPTPDCCTVAAGGASFRAKVVFRSEVIFVRGSGESQSIGRERWKCWCSRKGVLRRRGGRMRARRRVADGGNAIVWVGIGR
jgi:hypothetical protein